jgi:SAM-dependent methyltransferase
LVVADLEAARRHFRDSSTEVMEDDSALEVARFYVRDPFGNRIEIVAAADAGFTLRRASVQDVGGSVSLFSSAAADQYDRFVGRYTGQLARALIAAAGVRPGQRALDVGCGPGALAAELVHLLGPRNVAAVDPSISFVEACRARLAGVEVAVAAAENLPFADNTFDHSFAQLVVNFMTDAVAGVREMARVTRPGGRVVAAVWDYRGRMTMLRRFWDAVVATDERGAAVDEASTMRHADPDSLTRLLREADLADVSASPVEISAMYDDFEDLWGPFEAGIGPAGAYVKSLDRDARDRLKEEYRRLLGVGDSAFQLQARAWLGVGTVR